MSRIDCLWGGVNSRQVIHFHITFEFLDVKIEQKSILSSMAIQTQCMWMNMMCCLCGYLEFLDVMELKNYSFSKKLLWDRTLFIAFLWCFAFGVFPEVSLANILWNWLLSFGSSFPYLFFFFFYLVWYLISLM